MFVRMYAGLTLAILIALLSSFALYHWQQQWRLQQQFEQVFAGSLQLILQAVNRHQGDKQARWLAIAEQLMGADLNIHDNPGQATGYFAVSEASSGYALEACDIEYCIALNVLSIREQHMRVGASLLINELGRKPAAFYDQELELLQQHFSVPLALQPLDDLPIEAQYISRLKRSDIVVQHVGQVELGMLIYALIPGQKQVLVIGPIIDAQAIPAVLVLVVVVLTLILVGGTGYAFIKRLESRINTIDSGVSRFAEHAHALQLADQNRDAVGRLSFNVSSMSARIHQLLQAQQHLIRAVGHELRTPLSRSQFRLQTLQEVSGSNAEAAITGLKKDLQDITNLIEEVLAFDRGELDLSRQDMALLPLLNELVSVTRLDFPNCRIDLDARGGDALWYGSSIAIQRICHNLLQNACKYGAGIVRITVYRESSNIFLLFEDNGPGIDEKQRPEVFMPFARLEQSRNKETGGLGLGLAIVENLCQQMDIAITLTDSALGGACFSLALKASGTQEAV